MQFPVEFLQFFPAKAVRAWGGEMRHGLIWLVMALAAVMPAFGATVSVNLGSASSFGLLGSTISDTGVSVVVGNVGATTTITGFPPGTVTAGFTAFLAPNGPTTTVGIAYSDFETAYNTALALVSTQPVLTGLGTTQTFTGNNVYTINNNIIDGTISTTSGTVLTFDAQNNPNEVFVIQIDEAFTVNGLLTFDLIGGAQAKNIFWIVKDDATISVSSNPAQTFDGSILASDFTMSASGQPGGSGVLAGTINGCVFTLIDNTLGGETDVNGCVGGGLPGGGPLASIPEPESSGLVSLGCLLGILACRKLRVSL